MITNRILEIILGIIGIVVIPAQILSTFILGILIRLTFGLLLFPISFIWTVFFLFPLIGLSYIYEKMAILRIPIAVIGIPVAILGNTFSALIPSMGEIESRVSKLLISESFPYSWHFYQLTLKNPLIKFTKGLPNLLIFFNRIKINDKLNWDYVKELKILNNL
ncbi:MAG: hypothetical protein ACOH1N_08245 [Lutibacter sp.]